MGIVQRKYSTRCYRHFRISIILSPFFSSASTAIRIECVSQHFPCLIISYIEKISFTRMDMFNFYNTCNVNFLQNISLFKLNPCIQTQVFGHDTIPYNLWRKTALIEFHYDCKLNLTSLFLRFLQHFCCTFNLILCSVYILEKK